MHLPRLPNLAWVSTPVSVRFCVSCMVQLLSSFRRTVPWGASASLRSQFAASTSVLRVRSPTGSPAASFSSTTAVAEEKKQTAAEVFAGADQPVVLFECNNKVRARVSPSYSGTGALWRHVSLRSLCAV